MEPLKNAFSYPKARLIAEAVKRAHPAFSLPQFSKRLEVALEPLELEQRMRLIADRIEAGLPAHPPELFAILTEALAVDEGDPHGLRGFLVWPLTEIVARRGLGHFPESMAALCEMTNRFTGEFAIRPFLRKHRERTLKQLHAWCDHPDEHVRRLVSEGSGPLVRGAEIYRSCWSRRIRRWGCWKNSTAIRVITCGCRSRITSMISANITRSSSSRRSAAGKRRIRTTRAWRNSRATPAARF